MDDTVVIDATHFEARDQAPTKEEKPMAEPKKSGRKSKEEREQWMQDINTKQYTQRYIEWGISRL